MLLTAHHLLNKLKSCVTSCRCLLVNTDTGFH